MKKIVSIFLTLILLVSVCPFGTFCITASAEETATNGTTSDCYWSLDGTVLTIRGDGYMERYDSWENLAPWGTSITQVIVEEGVLGISEYAFYDCSLLNSVTLPKSLQEISSNAFSNCISLEKIYIPENVYYVSTYAFYNCNNFSEFVVDENNRSYTSVSGVLFDKRLTRLYYYPCAKKDTSYVVPNTITTIENSAFADCTSLVSIELPENLTYINSYAFSNCTALETINIPDTVKEIGSDILSNTAYYNNENNWENDALYNGKFLINVNLSGDSFTVKDGTTTIASYSFSWNNSLKTVILPTSVVNICGGAFSECSNLKDVWYQGYSEERARIEFNYGNDCLVNANWHLGSCTDQNTHVFKNNCDATCEVCGFTRLKVHTYSDIFADRCNLCGLKREVNIPVQYNIINGEAVITGCDSEFSGEIVLPSEIDGYPLIKIEEYAFSWCSNVTNIVLPETIKSIGSRAFYGTAFYNDKNNWVNGSLYVGNYLISVEEGFEGKFEIKEGTVLIADEAFAYCNGITEINIPSTVENIGKRIISGCKNIRVVNVDTANKFFKSVDGVVYDYSLEKLIVYPTASEITELELPNTLKEISSGAFMYNASLKKVKVPESVTEISYYTFEGCTSLEEVSLPETLTTIKDRAFNNCTSLSKINIPKSVTTISNGCFMDCDSLEEIDLSGALSIEELAFYGCDSLKEVIFSENLTSIGSSAFSYCYSMESINLGDNVVSLGSNTFEGCTSLKSVQMNSVTQLAYFMFRDCVALESVSLPDNLIKIRSGAFSGCSALKSIELKNGVEIIEDYVFSECETLENITIPNTVQSFGNYNLGGTAFERNASNYENGLLYINNFLVGSQENLSGKVVVKEGTVGICGGAFDNCENVTNIVLPNSVTNIGSNGFAGLTKLKNITLGSGIKNIADGAFCYCESLESITIPKGVTSLDWGTFEGCTSLQEINLHDNLTHITDYVFENSGYYNSEENWDNGVLYIGNHLIKANTSVSGSYTVKENTVAIAESAFADCASITEITIPSSVKYIGDYAFSDCNSLADINVTDSVEYIGTNAFYNTEFFNNIDNRENGILYVGRHLVDANENISGKYVVKDGTLSISPYAFFNCSSLTEISLPDSVKSIGSDAFTYCSALKTVSLGKGLKNIGSYAFSCCKNLTEIVIPNGVENIAEQTFDNCYALNSITLPKSLTFVGISAFGYCYNLKNVSFDGNEKDFKKIIVNSGNDYLLFANCEFSGASVGDVNGDGTVNVSDLAQLKKYIAGLLNDTEINECYPDTDENGIVNVADLAQLKKMLVGLA